MERFLRINTPYNKGKQENQKRVQPKGEQNKIDDLGRIYYCERLQNKQIKSGITIQENIQKYSHENS